MTNRNYVTILTIHLERGDERGIVQIRKWDDDKFEDGVYTLSTNRYKVGDRRHDNRMCLKLYDREGAFTWANTIVEMVIKNGGRVVAQHVAE